MRELAAFVLLMALPQPVLAHGRPPNVGQIVVDRSDPDHIVVQFSYGLLVSDDGGATFRFACSLAFGADPSIEDPPIAIADDGGVVLGTYDGIERGERDLCSFAPAPGTATETFVIDVVHDPHTENGLWAATARVPEPDALQHSSDGGRTWTIVRQTDPEMLIERITTAPSDPMRLYLSVYMRQTAEDPRRGLVLRSDDGGATFAPIEIPLVPEEQTPIVIGVDPTDADRIFIRVRKSEVDPSAERLLYSEDGGDTRSQVLAMPAIEGFAISDDGQTVWAGSADGGFRRATGGSTTFVSIGDYSIRAMAIAGGELWLSVNPYRHRYAIARSSDGGTTVDPVLWFEDVTRLVPCDTCSETNVLCNEFLIDLVYDVDRYLGPMEMDPPARFDGGLIAACAEGGVLPIDAGRRPDAGRALDGGVGDAGVMEVPAGCGCRGGRGGQAGALLVVLALVLWRRRR